MNSTGSTDDDWWVATTMMDERDDLWHEPLLDTTEDEQYSLPFPAYKCTIGGEADMVDVTEACTTDDDEEDTTLDGIQDSDGNFWLKGIEPIESTGITVDVASEKDTPLKFVDFSHRKDSYDDRWRCLASDEFLCLEFMEEERGNGEPSLLNATAEKDTSATIAAVSKAQELAKRRASLAASMSASQKSRRDCWNRSSVKQLDVVLQQRHPQVTRVLAKIAESTATVQNHCL